MLSITVVDLLTFFQGGNLNKRGVVSLMWLAARHFGMVLTPSCTSMPVMIDPFIFFWPVHLCVNNNVVRVCVGPCRGFKFSLRGPQHQEQIDPIETFIDCEVAHLSVPYSWFGDCHTGTSYQKLQFLKFVGGIVKRYFLSLQIFHPLYILLGQPPPQNLR